MENKSLITKIIKIIVYLAGALLIAFVLDTRSVWAVGLNIIIVLAVIQIILLVINLIMYPAYRHYCVNQYNIALNLIETKLWGKPRNKPKWGGNNEKSKK